MTRVFYTPQENGDPIETVCCGFHFRNGEPTEVPDDATVLQVHRVQVGESGDGEPRYKGMEVKTSVLEILKRNPYFRVDGAEPAPTVKKQVGRPTTPKTPEEYKAFAMAWFSRAESHTALAERWEAEASLREKCSVHDDSDVVSYLRQFFDGRYLQLKKAAA